MQPENLPEAELGNEEIVTAELDHSAADRIGHSKRSFLEHLLSPQSLQWMMACGSGLLVAGFVVWLWTAGIFENPLVIASAAGAATFALLGGGMAMVLKTRHQLAGKWLTLVGAMALPLNLWLYDAQGLITLADGGHLWIPAALCCVIYAGIARVLRDATFVYALVSGIVLTGMLFLADQTIGRFWEWMPPVKFLMVIGWLSVFAEQLFPNEKSDFAKDKFGIAFFRAGIIVVTCGLALMLGGFVSVIGNWMFDSSHFTNIGTLLPLESITASDKLWAIGMILVSAIGFGAQSVLRKSRKLILITAPLLAWAALIAMNLLSISLTLTSFTILAASVVIVSNLFEVITRSRTKTWGSSYGDTRFAIKGVAVGLLSILAIYKLLIHAVFYLTGSPVTLISWWTVFQFVLTAAASWTLAWNANEAKKHDSGSVHNITGFVSLGGVMTVLTAWAAVLAQSIVSLPSFALGALFIPVAFASAIFIKHNRAKSAIAEIASATMVTHLLVSGLFGIAGLFSSFDPHSMWISLTAIASAVFLAASRESLKEINLVLSLLSLVASVSVAGHLFGFAFGYSLIVAPMIAGTSIKIVGSIFGDHVEVQGVARQTMLAKAANFVIFPSGIASTFLAMSRWLVGNIETSLMVVMLISLVCTVLSSFLTKNADWKTAFRALIIAIVGSSLCVLDGLLDLDVWHRGEICSLVGGTVLLILGHLAWLREENNQADDVATISLFLGSLLVLIPISVGLVIYRVSDTPETLWRLFHEIAAIAGGLVMLGLGIVCRIRSTSISGGILLTTFLVSLITLIRLPSQLHNASVVMMVGGGVFLGTAILMSIYRDRLVAIPQQVRDGEGVFQVLKWR